MAYGVASGLSVKRILVVSESCVIVLKGYNLADVSSGWMRLESEDVIVSGGGVNLPLSREGSADAVIVDVKSDIVNLVSVYIEIRRGVLTKVKTILHVRFHQV